MAFIKERTD